MKNLQKRLLKLTCAALLLGGSAQAQIYMSDALPPQKPITAEARQKLRAALLQLLASRTLDDDYMRPQFALPLAQLGDWDGALRLVQKDRNAPRYSDRLWHWRAQQLALAGKGREVPAAASHIRSAEGRADAYLFAARTAIERGALLREATAASKDLAQLLVGAAPIIEKGSHKQRAYRGYLLARAGDIASAERVFTRTYEAARRADENARAEAKKKGDKYVGVLDADNARSVLLFQVRAGQLEAALQQNAKSGASVNRISLGWWIARARTSSELEALRKYVEALPPAQRVEHLFTFSIVYSLRGDKAQARAFFQQAREQYQAVRAALPKEQTGRPVSDVYILSAFHAAHFLGDAALQKQVLKELRQYSEESKKALEENSGTYKHSGVILSDEDLALLPWQLDLLAKEFIGEDRSNAVRSAPDNLDEISAALCAAPPSENQLQALEIVARYYFALRQNDKLRTVAGAMRASAEKLDAAKPDDKSQRNFWPRSLHLLSAILWLQRAGDNEAVADFARTSARNLAEHDRPFAAMAYFQLGLPQLADAVFDPRREIPRIAAQRLRNKQLQKYDENLFSQWGLFAAMEANYRATDAPLRWLNQLDENQRAEALRECIAARFPEPRQNAPFVSVTPGGGVIGSY